MNIPFHLAFPVNDLAKAIAFYHGFLGCTLGRQSDLWVDFNFFGHQITAHLSVDDTIHPAHNPVDGKNVPVRHFGAVLPWQDWQKLGERLQASPYEFIIEPYVRFQGQVGEQGTFFVKDPSGNGVEFKSFRDEKQLFAT